MDIKSYLNMTSKEYSEALDIRSANVLQLLSNMGDVYKNYHWSVNSPNQDYIEEVPIIILTEWQSNSGPLLEDLTYTIKTIESALKTVSNATKPNPYLSIYNGEKTGNVYQLPFFSPYNHTMNNEWGDPEHSDTITSEVQNIIGKAGGLFQRGLVEKRRVWKGSSPASYQFSFTLYNTYDPYVDIPKNFQLIKTLIHNNLADRTTFASLLPPCFYTLEIPGIRYSPMAILGGIDVQNIGQVNRKTIILPDETGAYKEVKMNIPDAWEITISVNELHNESRDIYNATFDPKYRSKVNVIDESVLGADINTNGELVPKGGINIKPSRAGAIFK